MTTVMRTAVWERVESAGGSVCHLVPLLGTVPPLGELHPQGVVLEEAAIHRVGPPGDSVV